MRIALFTLTYNRLDITQKSVASIKEKAGYKYDYFILDNGSIDGTVEWLKKNKNEFKSILFNDCNKGVPVGKNQVAHWINEHYKDQYDLIIKIDNDCEIITPNILKEIVKVYEDENKVQRWSNMVLAPHVDNITQPRRHMVVEDVSGYSLGMTSYIGGIFMIMPPKLFFDNPIDEDLAMASGSDVYFCYAVSGRGNFIGYIEELHVKQIGADTEEYKKQKQINMKTPYKRRV